MNKATDKQLNYLSNILKTEKKELISFKEKYRTIISKPLKLHVRIETEDCIYKSNSTFFLESEQIDFLPNSFFLTFAQEYIDKQYELRVFYFKERIYSMAIFSQLDEKTKLILVGNGPYKEYLQKLTIDLEIWQSVEFVDWMCREELKTVYADASAFLFPSHEGAGMVVAEALSYGLPVICFDNCGPGEFVDDTCGIRIPYTKYNESISDFAKALRSLKSNNFLYDKLSKGAIEKFNRDFDWNVRGDLLRDVYDKVYLKAG